MLKWFFTWYNVWDSGLGSCKRTEYYTVHTVDLVCSNKSVIKCYTDIDSEPCSQDKDSLVFDRNMQEINLIEGNLQQVMHAINK